MDAFSRPAERELGGKSKVKLKMEAGKKKVKKVVVIGAGPSGLPSIKSCLEEGLDVVCFEKEDSIGGIWKFREDKPCSLTPTTRMNTNKLLGSYSDFPPPSDYPIYLPHAKTLEYLEMYAKEFGLFPHIRLNHKVKSIELREDGGYEVVVLGPDNKTFGESADGVMVCVGHDNIPEIPDIPGIDIFRGKCIHSQEYLKAEDHRGEKVLIVGNGNTAGDIAHELDGVADRIYLSSRTGFVVIPRFVPHAQDLPVDDSFKRRFRAYVEPYIPYALRWFLFQRCVNPDGKQITFNIKPQERAMEHKILINDHLADMITSGRVVLRKGIQSLSKTSAVLDDGEVDIDTVIMATGYQVTLPFLPEKFTRTESLYKLILPVDLPKPTLGMIGMVNALGPFFPLMEMQARWFVQVFQGKIPLPSREEMLADRREMLEAMGAQKQYGRWQALCIDPIPYTDGLARQMNACPEGSLIHGDPALLVCCKFGPALPFQYRLKGPHSWSLARETILGHPSNQWILSSFNQLVVAALFFGLLAVFVLICQSNIPLRRHF